MNFILYFMMSSLAAMIIQPPCSYQLSTKNKKLSLIDSNGAALPIVWPQAQGEVTLFEPPYIKTSFARGLTILDEKFIILRNGSKFLFLGVNGQKVRALNQLNLSILGQQDLHPLGYTIEENEQTRALIVFFAQKNKLYPVSVYQNSIVGLTSVGRRVGRSIYKIASPLQFERNVRMLQSVPNFSAVTEGPQIYLLGKNILNNEIAYFIKK